MSASSRDRDRREHTTADVPAASGWSVVVSSVAGVWGRPVAPGEELVVGRSADVGLVVDDPSVSRRHARLELTTPPRITDLGSHNATRVLGRRLLPDIPTILPMGSVAEIGAALLMVVEGRGAGDSTILTAEMPSDEGPVIAEPSMQRLYAMLEIIAPSALAVLILGETGTGKEVYAHELHRRSARSKKPFVTLNCAALTESILESELFGHERGAFTGAVTAKEGLLQTAHGGSVFLDEIGELPLATQAKLLRVLQSGEMQRVGGVRPVHVDVRIVSATNRDLERRVAEGSFRADLFYRINGFVVTLPPLRDRPADILPLARQAIFEAARAAGRDPPKLTRAVLERLCANPWPGNVRELRATLQRAVVLAGHRATLTVDDLMLPPVSVPGSVRPPDHAAPATPAASDERARIMDALSRTHGNQTEAARILGVSRRTLTNWLNRLDVGRPRKR